MKRQLSAVSLFVIALSAQSAYAAGDGTINFTGGITSATCTININGQGSSPIIKLPNISNHGFTATSTTGGSTSFNVVLSGCTNITSTNNVLTYFQGGSGVLNGNLTNTHKPLSDAATGIAVQITDSANNPVVIGSSTQYTGPTASFTGVSPATATMSYNAQYISTLAAVTPGSYSGTVTYSINYQ